MQSLGLYSSVLTDRSVRALSNNHFKVFILCLAIAAEHDGYLPSDDEMCRLLRLRVALWHNVMAQLLKLTLLERDACGLTPRKWLKYHEKQAVDKNSGTNPAIYCLTSLNILKIDLRKKEKKEVSKKEYISRCVKNVKQVKHCREPRHLAKNREFIYCRAGTPELLAYQEDFRAKRGVDPNLNPHGGRWFRLLGEK